MTNEERDLITAFVQRVGGTPTGFTAPVAQPQAPAVPIDPEADALLAQLFARYPEARYRITQMAFVQEHALAEAQNRLRQLEWQLQQLQQQQAPAAPAASPWGQQPQASSPPPARGLFASLFGGGSSRAAPPPPPPPAAAPPPPQYAPGYSPGMFQPRGSGFLGSALTTAAGVAGGMVAGNALMNLLSGGHGGFGGVPAAQAASPWASGGDPYDVGGADKSVPDASAGWQDASGGQDSGWQDASGGQDSGWQDASGGQDSGWQDGGSDIGGSDLGGFDMGGGDMGGGGDWS
jgi:hypothetical protein